MIINIKTKPKDYNIKNEKIVLAKILEPNFKIIVASEFGYLGNRAHARLAKELSDIVKCDATKVCGKISIVLKISGTIHSESNKNFEQGYKIYVDDTSVRIIGFSDLGLYYGVTTFLQLIDVTNDRVEIAKVRLLDIPDSQTRGYFINESHSSCFLDIKDYKAIIDKMALYKMNQLSLYIDYKQNENESDLRPKNLIKTNKRAIKSSFFL